MFNLYVSICRQHLLTVHSAIYRMVQQGVSGAKLTSIRWTQVCTPYHESSVSSIELLLPRPIQTTPLLLDSKQSDMGYHLIIPFHT